MCYIQVNRFAAANTDKATKTKTAVLRGVNEQAALYPRKQFLLTSTLGKAVLTAAMHNTIIINSETAVIAVNCTFSPPLC
jgi:hypothetical protein